MRTTIQKRQSGNPVESPEMPWEVQEALDSAGGVNGLCKRLPSPARLEKIGRIHNALSDPIRLKILYILEDQPLCVCVIKECIKIADSKLSYHLTVLKKADLIVGEQQGTWIIYQLTKTGKQMLMGLDE